MREVDAIHWRLQCGHPDIRAQQLSMHPEATDDVFRSSFIQPMPRRFNWSQKRGLEITGQSVLSTPCS